MTVTMLQISYVREHRTLIMNVYLGNKRMWWILASSKSISEKTILFFSLFPIFVFGMNHDLVFKLKICSLNSLPLQTVFLSCCPDYRSYPAHLNSIGWATWAVWAAVKDYNVRFSIVLCLMNESWRIVYFFIASQVAQVTLPCWIALAG